MKLLTITRIFLICVAVSLVATEAFAQRGLAPAGIPPQERAKLRLLEKMKNADAADDGAPA